MFSCGTKCLEIIKLKFVKALLIEDHGSVNKDLVLYAFITFLKTGIVLSRNVTSFLTKRKICKLIFELQHIIFNFFNFSNLFF